MFVREHTRYAVELAVRMKCSTWADYLELHTSNLSRGGLFVPSQMTAPIGTELAIELTLPNATVVRLRGEVVHLTEATKDEPAGMGVMFFGVDATAKRALEEALRLAKASAPAAKPAPPPLPVAAAPPPPPIPVKAAPPPAPPLPVKAASPPLPVKAAPPPLPVKAAPPPPVDAAPPSLPTTEGWDAPAEAEPAARAPKFADAVEQALLDELARRLDLPPHDQLGVTPQASDEELAEAYGRLKERYAPSIFARYGSSTAAVIVSINAALDAAHQRLQDPNERRAIVGAAHQPKTSELTPTEQEQKRRGEEARAALRAGIERRVEEACAHRDMARLDDAIRGFEQVLELDRKHEYARAELAKLRDLKIKRKR
jgi:uncharacterized protein (TIGR02266 family)